MRRCAQMPPRVAIGTLFAEIIRRSISDKERKGCMLINAALEVAPHDEGFQHAVATALIGVEQLFRDTVTAG